MRRRGRKGAFRPVDALHPPYVRSPAIGELPKILIDQIAHFFKHYKDLESRSGLRSSAGAIPSRRSR